MNKYHLDNQQPFRNNQPVKISTLIADLNKLVKRNEALINETSILNARYERERQIKDQLLHEMDSGLNE